MLESHVKKKDCSQLLVSKNRHRGGRHDGRQKWMQQLPKAHPEKRRSGMNRNRMSKGHPHTDRGTSPPAAGLCFDETTGGYLFQGGTLQSERESLPVGRAAGSGDHPRHVHDLARVRERVRRFGVLGVSDRRPGGARMGLSNRECIRFGGRDRPAPRAFRGMQADLVRSRRSRRVLEGSAQSGQRDSSHLSSVSFCASRMVM